MRSLFERIARTSIHYRWLTIIITIVAMILGTYAALDLNIELLPPIDVPSTFIFVRSHGSPSTDLMLQAYTVPLEDGAENVEGVMNRESSTSSNYVFLEIRNDFGLDQDALQDDLQTVLDNLDLPWRILVPSDDTTPEQMIGDLSPDMIMYLYAYSQENDQGFLPQLTSGVWQSFSPEVLRELAAYSLLPPDVIATMDEPLRAELQAANGTPSRTPPTELSQATPSPDLPATWQMDRFENVKDLAELTSIRNMADIFNAFVENGYLAGPLGTVADVTPQDIETILNIEARCQTEVAANNPDGTPPTGRCDMFSYLDGSSLGALLLRDDLAIQDRLWSRFDVLPSTDRNEVAALLVAQTLLDDTPSDAYFEAELPAEWRFEKPSLISFSFSDIPLANISVSAEMSNQELQRLVEDNIIPRLESIDAVAEITVQGGEQIPAQRLQEAMARDGNSNAASPMDAVPDTLSDGSASDPTTDSTSPDNSAASDTVTQEGPPLPASWASFSGMVDLDELDTADDLLEISGTTPSELMNSLADLRPVELEKLSADVLLFLADNEVDFFSKLSVSALQALSPDTLAALPGDVQVQLANSNTSPPLGTNGFWNDLASQPLMTDITFQTADDLLRFGDPAGALNQIVGNLPPKLDFYAVHLIDDLSGNAVRYLVENDPDFLNSLQPDVFCAFSLDVLQSPEVAQAYDSTWQCRPGVTLGDIASGDAATAVETLSQDNDADRVYDPSAPALPSNWAQITGNLGAEKLQTADDIFYTVESDGSRRMPSGVLNALQDYTQFISPLTADTLLYVADCDRDAGPSCEADFFSNLDNDVLVLISEETAQQLPEAVQKRRSDVLRGIYTPDELVTRTNGDNSLLLEIRKNDNANTVAAWAEVEEVLTELETENAGVEFNVAFEQAGFIEESISGVAREGGLGAVMAVVVILIFLNFSIRSTLVTAVSIPTSVALAFVVMRWVPGNVHDLLYPLAADSDGIVKEALDFVLRLFPETVSLNIMTLSGLTVAIGRVVDDAIVVLENIYRNIQKGEDRLQAVIEGTRDVSVAIFAATVTTVVVFLPIGLFGGVIGAFFLPFGLAVTYALGASFIVAITVVPLLAYLFINKESLPEDDHSRMEHGYRRVIEWSLAHRWLVMGIATLAFVLGMFVLSQRPTAFLPSFGEPTISIDVTLPKTTNDRPTTIADTDVTVRRLEDYLIGLGGIGAIQTSVGGGGQDGLVSSDSISENEASLTLSVESQDVLDDLTLQVRAKAEEIFGGSDYVTVSSASLSEQGFAGFAVVVSGNKENPPTLAELAEYDPLIISTLEQIEGVTNVESTLERVALTGGDVTQTYIRVDGIPAVRYSAELETEDTLGLTQEALDAVKKLELPDKFTVGEGYESELQTEGFRQTFASLGIAVLIVYIVMVLTFGSLVHPVTILFSLPLAVVGAAVGLSITGRVLGLSSVVGLLMLVGIVVTNAIVLLDRVQTNRKERDMDVRQALIDGGTTRLRPILMTAIATMFALLPLAIGLSEGAIIAAELGTVVIGGLFSSTLLTLIVVPVVYSLFAQVQAYLVARLQ
jgi:multidrug efflux pump subunit AcrB